MGKKHTSYVERLLDVMDKRIAETEGVPREWHWRAVQDGACQMLAAIHMDERAERRRAEGGSRG